MKRWTFLVLALACFAGAGWLIAMAQPVVPPELWVEKAVIDMGDLSQGQSTVAQFVLANHFSQSLEIVDVLHGCSCSEATLAKNQLLANEKTELRVKWSTGRARGRHGTNVEVIFKLADGSQNAMSLRVEGNVVPDIVVEPEKLSFDGNKQETRTLRLKPGRMAKFIKIARITEKEIVVVEAMLSWKFNRDCSTVSLRPR